MREMNPLPNEEMALRKRSECTHPSLARLVTSYSFGELPEAERLAVERHLLECDSCWESASRLDRAARTLRHDRSLLDVATVEEIASTFGISGKLQRVLGGHRWHSIIASLLYAALYAVALLVEVAYQYDQYRQTAPWVAMAIFVWIFLTSLAGLTLDWKLTHRGSQHGLKAAAGVFVAAAVLATLGVLLYLPAAPVSELSLQAYTAQAAYLKTVLYFQVFLFTFLLPPFHFILAAQRECVEGRQKLIGGLLSGAGLAVAPRGTIYPRFSVLVSLLVIILGVSLFLHQNLMNHLRPGPYMSLFSNLIFLRLILFYGFAAKCLHWYYLALNELKRECVVVMRRG